MIKILGGQISQWQLLLLLIDSLLYWFAVLLAFIINPILQWRWSYFSSNAFNLVIIWLTYLTIFYIADLYDYQQDFRQRPIISRLFLALIIGTAAIIVLFFFPLGNFIGRWQLLLQAAIYSFLLITWRWAFSALAIPRRLKRRLLIIGAGKAGRRLLEAIRRRHNIGLEVVGFVDDDQNKIGTEIDGVPVLGSSEALPVLHKQLQVKLLVLAITHEKSQKLLQTLTRVSWNGCQVIDMPTAYEYLANKIPIDHISDVWLFLNSLRTNKFYYRHLKRFLDLILSIILLILALPLLIVCAILIKLDSPGEVFYIQERMGQNGRPFRLIKFRTMFKDAEAQGPQWASVADPRITRVGHWLRKYRLDELPQLINVLKGEMSLVGPRPEREVFIREFVEPISCCRRIQYGGLAVPLVIDEFREKIPYYSYRLLVKPGITGWAQIMYNYASSFEETKEKLQYDLYYIKNMSFLLDLSILLKTIPAVIGARGR